MKIKAIVMRDNPISENAWSNLKKSFYRFNPDLKIERVDAITAEEVNYFKEFYHVEWNYPWTDKVTDFKNGLVKTAYKTSNPKARVAAALSHYKLWLDCLKSREPFIILEHDALWLRKLDFLADDTTFDILGLNSPMNATRKASVFHNIIQERKDRFQKVPRIDEPLVPQGLAGNSAYMMKPRAAKQMIELVRENGLWPNDAIMCYQLFPNMGVTKRYYTKVQGTRSTTTL